MAEATPATAKAKSAKPVPVPPGTDAPKTEAPNFDLSKYDIPSFELPKVEVPAAFREVAEKSVAQAREGYEKMKAMTEEATAVVEGTYAAASKGATDYNLKVIEIARANTNAAFDFARALIGVKSLSEVLEVSTGHARKQFETLTGQSKELTELAQKVVVETSEPLKAGIGKAFRRVA